MNDNVNEPNGAINAAPVDENLISIDINKSITKMPKFEPLKAYHDLCIGKLVKVEVVMRDIAATKENGDVSTYEFAGMQIPRLLFTFHNHLIPGVDEVEREFVKAYDVIGFQSEADGGKPLENYKLVYNGMFEQITHMMQYYNTQHKGLASPAIPGIVPNAPTQTRLTQFVACFQAVAGWFNSANNGKPVFLDAAAKPIISAIKLVTKTKTNGDGKSYKTLDFPSYLKEGFIAKFKSLSVAPAIKLSGNETTVLGGVTNTPTGKAADSSIPSIDDLPPEVRAAMGQA